MASNRTNKRRVTRQRQKSRNGQPDNSVNPIASDSMSTPSWSSPFSKVITPSSDRINRKYIEHKFIMTSGPVGFTGSATNPLLSALTFSFGSLPLTAALANLYDQYRIDVCEVRFCLRNQGTAVSFPRLSVFPDFDNAGAPANLNAVLAHPRLTQHNFSLSQTDYTIAISPRAAIAAFAGTFSAYGQTDRPIFLDVSQPAALHYGVKFSLENFTDATQNIDVFVKYWITMRNPL